MVANDSIYTRTHIYIDADAHIQKPIPTHHFVSHSGISLAFKQIAHTRRPCNVAIDSGCWPSCEGREIQRERGGESERQSTRVRKRERERGRKGGKESKKERKQNRGVRFLSLPLSLSSHFMVKCVCVCV